MNHKLIPLGLLLLSSFSIAAQVLHTPDDHSVKRHALALLISHTQISEGIQENGNRKWLSLPSWGINYNYHFHSKWAVGLHTDIIVEDFEVEPFSRSDDEVLERSYPIASAVMASFKPGKHFSYMAGLGGEFAREDSFFLVRVGLEYGLHLPNNWELLTNITNDLKLDAYNSWALGLGVAKKF
ncbi:MAG: hypothetical protein AAFX53_13855 [Bacteroidota bacterium]